MILRKLWKCLRHKQRVKNCDILFSKRNHSIMINRNIVWNITASVVLSITLSALMMIDLSFLCETDVLVFNNIMQYYCIYF